MTAVLAGLLDVVSEEHRLRATAVALAELGSDAGAEVLRTMLGDEDTNLAREPDGKLFIVTSLPYETSSVRAAAWALERLGDDTGLSHEEAEVRLAAAAGLAEARHPGARPALSELAEDLDRVVEGRSSRGELRAPRERGDHTRRYPEDWVRVHHLLSRLGDDGSLRRLAEAARIDWQTFPAEESSTFPRLEIVRWSHSSFGGPSLNRALATADPDVDRLIERLEGLDLPTDEVVEAVRAARDAPPAEPELRAEPVTDLETLDTIASELASSDPETRARGLAGAGFHRVDEHFRTVLETAVEGVGVERRAARYGLGFYDRQIPEEALRRMGREGSVEDRFVGLELATREHPAVWAPMVLEWIHDLVELDAEMEVSAGGRDFEVFGLVRFAPRLISRFSREKIPPTILAGLEGDMRVASLVAAGLGMGGNPDALEALHHVSASEDDEVAAVAAWAIRTLTDGPHPGS